MKNPCYLFFFIFGGGLRPLILQKSWPPAMSGPPSIFGVGDPDGASGPRLEQIISRRSNNLFSTCPPGMLGPPRRGGGPQLKFMQLFFTVNLYTRTRNVGDKVYYSFIVVAHNSRSHKIVRSYFYRFPLYSSKYLAYKDWCSRFNQRTKRFNFRTH
jgi:hypothetical protein